MLLTISPKRDLILVVYPLCIIKHSKTLQQYIYIDPPERQSRYAGRLSDQVQGIIFRSFSVPPPEKTGTARYAARPQGHG